MTPDDGRVLAGITADFDSWRSAARELLLARVDPRRVQWKIVVSGDGRTIENLPPVDPSVKLTLSRRFIETAERVARHGTFDVWPLLYRIAYRLMNEDRDLLSSESDVDVRALFALEQRPVERTQAAPPDASIVTEAVPPIPERRRSASNASSSLPPELQQLLGDAAQSLRRMSDVQRESRNAAAWVPVEKSVASIAEAVGRCEGCDLCAISPYVAAGSGPSAARVMIVGEQPDDPSEGGRREFAGAAGELFDRALATAKLSRADVYVTSAVKHVAVDVAGTRRTFRAPMLGEVAACRPWLDAEIEAVKPDVIVCLGNAAARALGGASFNLIEERGEFVQTRGGRTMIATIHPAAVLRAGEELAVQYETWLMDDFRRVRERLENQAP